MWEALLGKHAARIEAVMEPGDFLRIKAVLEHPYQQDVCFLCAGSLNSANRTDEHVIPGWLQHEFNLWDQPLTLLNGTKIPYRNLTIPCCAGCNNGTLARLESRICTALTAGYQAVFQLPRFELFRWLSKIYLGLQYRELFLAAERSSPGSATILEPDFVRRSAILHCWLQASATTDATFCPGSVWVFPVQVPSDLDQQFDLMDDVFPGTIAMRIKGVAVFADFLENGVHERISREAYAGLQTTPLHPTQFAELFARIVYGSRRLRQQTKVEFVDQGSRLRIRFDWQPTTISGEIMDPWIVADYAQLLAKVMGVPIQKVYDPPRVATWLFNPQGEPVFWEIGKPFPFTDVSLGH